MAFMLAMQSDGPSRWIGSYLEGRSPVSRRDEKYVVTYHCGYSNRALVVALLAMPPYKMWGYVFTENAVWAPAKLPPYRIQGVPGAETSTLIPGNETC